ncbi:MAG TPA: hypothetical protein VF943_06230 [Burkholderiales bacterium]
MPGRVFLFALILSFAVPAFGQEGLSVPPRGEPGLDPSYARGWLSPEYGLQRFTTGQRPQWSYSLSDRSSLGMALYSGRELDLDSRQMSLFGRYSFSPSWAFSAETQLRDPGSVPRLQDLRFGVQRRF